MNTRRTYTPIRIDFTPFVSVALLLIVFFVWVKIVQRPNAMQVGFRSRPGTFCGEPPVADARLFLLDNNRIGFLDYQPNGVVPELVETDYSAEGLRNQLTSISLNHKYGASVVITLTQQATFKNLVDVLDELKIVNIRWFVLNYSLTSEERNMLKCYEGCKTKWRNTEVQCGHQARTRFGLYRVKNPNAYVMYER